MLPRTKLMRTPFGRSAARFIGFCLFVLLLLLLFDAIALPASAPRKILLLHSQEHETAPFADFEEAFRRYVGKESPGGVQFYEVSVQTDQGTDQETVLNYALSRFRKEPPALIVPLGGPAAAFAQKNRMRLFPSTPMLLAAVDYRHLANAVLTNNETAVAMNHDPAAAVENIFRILPETTNLFVVIGNSELERFWRRALEGELERFRPRITIEWGSDLSFAEMLKRCAALPSHSAILYGLLNVDAAGVVHTGPGVLADLHSIANAPLFGLQGSQMGRGIVGGPLLSMEELGRDTADVALRILKGESPASIHSQVHTAGLQSYDWRELRRWNIDESRLPPGSVLNFREPTLWQRYKWHVVVIATIGFAQLLLIFALVTNLVKRRRAEEVARGLGKQLLQAEENERARVARELHDDVTQRLARLAIDASGLRYEQDSAARDAITLEVRDEIVRLSEDVHALAYKTHPALLQRLGLADSLRLECERFSRQKSIDVSVNVEQLPAEIPHDTALCLVRITQEALINVGRHARSKSAEVSLRTASNGLELMVVDTGVGFDGKTPVRLGLASMQERVRLLKGNLTIDSRPDHGTRVRAWVPCEKNDSK